MNEERAQKIAEKMQKSFTALAQADAVVNNAIAKAVLALFEQVEAITVDALIAQLRQQTGNDPQRHTQIEAAEAALRAASRKNRPQ